MNTSKSFVVPLDAGVARENAYGRSDDA